MTTLDRLPLSVQVYDRLIARLQAAGICPGEVIPPETRLASELGVSRTVLREALRLLEEDGVLERAADRRRRQLAGATAPGASITSPLEHLVQVTGRLTTTVIRSDVAPATSWSARHLCLPVGAAVLTRETLLLTPDGPVASAIEMVAAETPDAVRVRVPARPERTMLADLGETFRAGLQPLVWRLAPNGVRSTRRGLERLPEDAVLGTLTIVLGRSGRPAHLAKYLLRLDALVLTAVSADLPPAELGRAAGGTP